MYIFKGEWKFEEVSFEKIFDMFLDVCLVFLLFFVNVCLDLKFLSELFWCLMLRFVFILFGNILNWLVVNDGGGER